MEVHTIPWYLSNSVFLLNETDELCHRMMTQLSAHIVTQKLMDNGMKKVIQNTKFKK